jgi:hypothetical protein
VLPVTASAVDGGVLGEEVFGTGDVGAAGR